MGTWKEILAVAGRDNTLERARGCIGKGTRYKLGRGGMDPAKPLTAECDCSGFVAWAIGIPRELPPGSGRWLQTTSYWRGGGDAGSGLFDETCQAEPGDVMVYPDVGGKQGHMGIVSEVRDGKPFKVIHCSKGNDTNHGQAILETVPDVFNKQAKTRIMKVDYVALRSLFNIPEPEEDGDELTEPGPRLQHPLLACDSTLQMVARGMLVLEETGGPVSGCGALHDALNRLAAVHSEYAVDLGPNRRYRGYYGPKTVQALKRFQKDQNLVASGDADSATVIALDAALRAIVSTAPVVPPVVHAHHETPPPANRVLFQRAAGGYRAVRGELVRRTQLKLKDAGLDSGDIDGIYGRDVETALKDFQRKEGLQENGKVTGETWLRLLQTECPSMLDRCLQLTADFEGHGFQKIVGNFDGAGLTWGIIGFTLQHGELQRILTRVQQDYPELLDQAFGSLKNELTGVLASSRGEQMEWAYHISIGSQRYRVEQPWENAFRTLGAFSQVQQIQLEHVNKYWERAVGDAERFQLETEMGIALCFDIAVQNGGIDIDSEERRIRRWIESNPGAGERDRRLIIADVVAENSKTQYIEDVRQRKRTIAGGDGTVHGARYAVGDWGIAEHPWRT